MSGGVIADTRKAYRLWEAGLAYSGQSNYPDYLGFGAREHEASCGAAECGFRTFTERYKEKSKDRQPYHAVRFVKKHQAGIKLKKFLKTGSAQKGTVYRI